MQDLLNSYFLGTTQEKLQILNGLIQEKNIKFLFKIFSVSDTDEKKLILECLDQGDLNGEFKAIYLEAMRTNSSELFSFMAHTRQYPKSFFTEAEYNQMVLKALFVDISVQKIIGIKERKNTKLKTMINDYIEERELANRSLPIGVEEYNNLGD